jgi:uncharacterized membrane protein YhaH (DUF805 family)
MWGQTSILKGRTNRATYALVLAIYVGLLAVAVMLNFKVPGEVFVAFACAPRLHDLGVSAWWFAFAILAEVAVVTAFAVNDQMAYAALAGTGVVLTPAIALLFIPGQREANRFGDMPAPGISWPKLAGPAT